MVFAGVPTIEICGKSCGKTALPHSKLCALLSDWVVSCCDYQRGVVFVFDNKQFTRQSFCRLLRCWNQMWRDFGMHNLFVSTIESQDG